MKTENSRKNSKINFLIEKLEELSGKKVKLEEVRRVPVSTMTDVIKVVKGLLKKHGLNNTSKITIKGNLLRVDDIKSQGANFAYKSVGFGLQEEGFNKNRVSRLNNKSYQKYVDNTNRFIVLLPI